MKSFILLKNGNREPLPANAPGADIRFAAALVERLLTEWTQPGDIVFDPFAGFGTTLTTAASMGRIPYGIELNEERWRFAQERLSPAHKANLIRGDVRELASYALPAFDFSLSSPPYMGRTHRENPLTDYAELGNGYSQYLQDIADVYALVGDRMKSGGKVVIEVSNLRTPDGLTMLAWDVAAEVGKVLDFQGEIVVGWENGYGYGYDHSYCLVFTKRGETDQAH